MWLTYPTLKLYSPAKIDFCDWWSPLDPDEWCHQPHSHQGDLSQSSGWCCPPRFVDYHYFFWALGYLRFLTESPRSWTFLQNPYSLIEICTSFNFSLSSYHVPPIFQVFCHRLEVNWLLYQPYRWYSQYLRNL